MLPATAKLPFTLTPSSRHCRAVISGDVRWTVLCRLSCYCVECHLLEIVLLVGGVVFDCQGSVSVVAPVFVIDSNSIAV